MSSSERKRSRLTESEPAPRRSARIDALELARRQSIQAEDRALPALRTRDRRRRAKTFVPPSHEDEFSKLEESLLPGISNDVVLPKISTLLPNESLQILSSVGRAWRQAMENRLVYDARVLADSGDSFVVISDTKFSNFQDEDFTPTICLCSLRSYTRYRLPPIAKFVSGIPYDCECIALDGRVYVLGGTKKSSRKSQKLKSKDVYVLDLAAPRQWKLCARMHEARANFKCVAKDSKIYVFGGTCRREWVSGSEVYDPNVNLWSAITPLRSWPSANKLKVNRRALEKFRRCSLHNSAATTDGEKLVVVSEEQEGGSYHLNAYYPVEDKWRTLSDDFPMFSNRPNNGRNAVEIMVEGKLHSISPDSISVYDIEENKWTKLYSCSFGSAQRQVLLRFSAVAVDNEIVAIIERYVGGLRGLELEQCLVRTIGFGNDVNEIVWEQLQGSFPVGYENPSMCFLKL